MATNAMILEATDDGISEAAKSLFAGGLVALPTETVYGLGANALIEDSVREIFRVKGRPLTDPLIVHVPNMKEALQLVDLEGFEKSLFETLGSSFWPGGLTLVAKQRSFLPLCLSAGTGYVGIRIPNHPIALKLLERAKCPVAAPSANRFGHVSPTSHLHVLNDLGTYNITILNGDSDLENTCKHGIESTVCKIDVENKELVIFRRGAVSEFEINNVLQSLIQVEEEQWAIRVITKHIPMPENYNKDGSIVGAAEESDEETKQIKTNEKGEVAPGQLITHYAPDVPTYILRSRIEEEAVAEEMDGFNNEEAMLDTVLLDFGGSLSWLKDHCLAYQDISPHGEVVAAGRGLFGALRWAECVIGAKRVLIADIESVVNKLATSDELEVARAASVSDRTFRAASGRVLAVVVGKFPPSNG